MPSVEELLSVAEVIAGTRSTMDSRIEIDADTRIIQMMPQDELFGVESDEKSERKYFKVPKIVGNGVDLSKLQLRINYQNASKIPSGKDMYIVTDATVYNDEWVYFSWELSRKVTQYKGNIYFIVCAVKADSKGNITNEWNTTLAEGKVLEGLEVETSQEQQYQASDYLEQLKQQLLDYSKEIKDTFPSDYTETVENVKNLQSDVEKLDNNKITKFYTNNNGDTALNDSDDGKIQDLVIYGKSERKQYKGKNLLNILKRNITVNGIVYTVNDDGTVILNGTASDIVDVVVSSSFHIEKGKTYRMTGWVKGQAGILYMLNLNETVSDNGDGITLVYNGDTTDAKVIHVQCQKNTVFHNVVIKPMIVDASIYPDTTYDDYEPYTGGKPSPSPEYPQEIKAVVNPVIKTYGKNLLKVTFQDKMQDGVTCTNNGDGTYTLNGTATRQTDFSLFGKYDSTVRIPTDIRKTYIIKKSGNSNIQFHVGVANKYIVTCATEDGLIENKAGISYFICRILSGTTLNNFKIYPQVEEGSVSTDFQPYQETQATLPYELYAIPVSSGGNVTIDGQQYIADYVDVERGKLVRMTELIEYDGTENWSLQSINNNGIANFQIIVTRYISSIGMCDTLQLQKTIISNTNTEGFMINNNNTLFIRINTTRGISTLETFKEFLANKHIFILYALSTPTEIDLVKEEITAFKALSTYYPKTYVDAESEQLEAYTMFNYPVSMEKGWEYVKQQIGDTRKYVYDMDTKLTETEASTLEAKIDTAILSEMIGG